MNKEQALHQFYSQFLKAYDENTVPKGAKLPYLTYTMPICDFGDTTIATISIWYREDTWKNITNKKEEISKVLGLGGNLVTCDDGAMWLKKGTPFAQRMNDEDDSIRRIAMNIEIEFIAE